MTGDSVRVAARRLRLSLELDADGGPTDETVARFGLQKLARDAL